MLEAGWTCLGGGEKSRDICTEICGGGGDLGNYACDDGNNINGDGCSSICTIEIGWTCASVISLVTYSVCTPICGDGWIWGVETCDDGNLISGDGCKSTCAVETGYLCYS